MYWAVIAQTMVLREIRDELRAMRGSAAGVTVPDEVPVRRPATVSVTEP